MSKPIQPTALQSQTLERIVSLANQRAGRNINTTLELLRTSGFDPLWRRVVWTGGVGSYRWMPDVGVIASSLPLPNPAIKRQKPLRSIPSPVLFNFQTLNLNESVSDTAGA